MFAIQIDESSISQIADFSLINLALQMDQICPCPN